MTVKDHQDWPKLFQEYGWEPDMIQVVSPNVWKVTCEEGSFALKATDVPSQKLQMIANLLSSAQKEGSDLVLPFIKSRKNAYFVQTNNCSWYATPWKKHKTSAYTEVMLAKSLGKFHRICEKLIEPYVNWQNQLSYQDIMDWKRKEIRLAGFADKIEAASYPSPFDKAFTKHKFSIEKPLLFAIRAAEKFVDNDDGVPPRYTLCHSRLHISNIVEEDNHIFLIDFDNAQIDTPIRDLATLLRRSSLQKNKASLKLCQDIIEAYESENPLRKKEKRLLAVALSYPERLLGVIERYYVDPDSNSVVDELDILAKFDHELSHFNVLSELVIKLWDSSKLKKTGVKN